VGTEFTVYDKGLSAKENKEKGETNPDPSTLRQELGAVCYVSLNTRTHDQASNKFRNNENTLFIYLFILFLFIFYYRDQMC
jgi:hypothetical protein